MVKTLRAYGGIVHLCHVGPGWEWKITKREKYTPPRILPNGLYLAFSGTHAFGWTAKRRDAIRMAVNTLKPRLDIPSQITPDRAGS